MDKTPITEEWRPVVGWPEYEVSNLGSVKRVAAAQRTRPGRVLQANGGTPYPAVSLSAKSRLPSPGWKRTPIHIIVIEAFHGPRPSARHEVAHNDGNPKNNQANNLRWATASENQLDRLRHGTACQGETHTLSKLTDAQVNEIRNKAGTVSYRKMAVEYGVSDVLISNIVRRKTWKHI
jgi:hypothetical protein